MNKYNHVPKPLMCTVRVAARDIVAACTSDPLKLRPLIDQVKRFTASGRGKSVAPISSSTAGWARYCINEGHTFRVYTLGYELLTGADCTDQGSIWLQRGFAALAQHVGKL